MQGSKESRDSLQQWIVYVGSFVVSMTLHRPGSCGAISLLQPKKIIVLPCAEHVVSEIGERLPHIRYQGSF